MGEQPKKTYLSAGLLAHVDAGKTTLSEALLYLTGVRRTLGRVDRGDAFLDTHDLERARGVTIFSKLAHFTTEHLDITLVDTPGHADFSPEAERVLPVLDCAILVISGTDGIQSHTQTLWGLLERYHIPVVLFINKMDLPGLEKNALLCQLQQKLSPGCLDFEAPTDEIAENAALCDEALLETYLHSGTLSPEAIRDSITRRRVFPCCFGSGLKLTGIETLLEIVDKFAPRPEYPREFGAKVFKISRDARGNRLTWLKLTGGSLKVRAPLCYTGVNGDAHEEKILQLRMYSGDKFTVPEEVFPGALCAIAGLTATWAGQGLGREHAARAPLLEPVMTYRLALPKGYDPVEALRLLRQLEEEEPQLHVIWNSRLEQIQLQIMGNFQREILTSLLRERFSLDAALDSGHIYYKETISNTVEGVGHFEPLRHYAEVHLLLEPLPRGSGLVFSSVCPVDVLDSNYQNLILTHLEEKTHLGVLTGSPVTDMKITLLVGKAHLKHTEGGDFRQATYRAVRQGLMEANSVLLEPWYSFTLTLPTEQVGRAITDIRAMSGEFDPPEASIGLSTLRGRVPAGELKDYADQVASYTQGRGRLWVAIQGYAPCHNQEAVLSEMAYDPEADLDNTPDSVFCAHGSGFTVKWDQVKSCMHLESGLKESKPAQPMLITRNLRMDDKELDAIMEREFGPIKQSPYRPAPNRPAREEVIIRPPKSQCLIVDGYNVIFAWDALAEAAGSDLDAARRQLLDILSSYAGYKKCRLILVFDGYKVKGNPGEKERCHNLQVVYTKEGQTADAYIEALVSRIGNNYAVQVVSSDSLIQLSSFRSGVLRMSARELKLEVAAAQKEMRKHFAK